jgi:hypothetical protein
MMTRSLRGKGLARCFETGGIGKSCLAFLRKESVKLTLPHNTESYWMKPIPSKTDLLELQMRLVSSTLCTAGVSQARQSKTL